MRTYGQYCPIARGSEIFAERWTPIIMRNLLMGCETFTEIQRGAPRIPRSLLTQRLDLLQRHGIIERVPNAGGRGYRYRPTEAGMGLAPVCSALGEWGARWLDIAPEHLDPYLALWSMCKGLDAERVPDARVVVRFDFPGQPKRSSRFWLLIEHRQAEVCLFSVGDEDLIVTADAAAFSLWQMGRLRWADAIADERVHIEGPRRLAGAFPTWNTPGPFADITPIVSAKP